MSKRIISKSDKALELSEKGLSSSQIAARIGSKVGHIAALIKCAKERREREIERAGKLADILGANI